MDLINNINNCIYFHFFLNYNLEFLFLKKIKQKMGFNLVALPQKGLSLFYLIINNYIIYFLIVILRKFIIITYNLVF